MRFPDHNGDDRDFGEVVIGLAIAGVLAAMLIWFVNFLLGV